MKRKRISGDETRFLLSDMLPYEVPACFSNRGLVAFLKRNNVEFCLHDNGSITIKYDISKSKSLRYLLCLLFCANKQKDSEDLIVEKNLVSKPYQFKVPVRNDKIRILSVVHPASQVQAMLFNERFKNLFVFCCGKSAFSIRHPVAVAKMKYMNDKAHFLPGFLDKDKSSRVEHDSLEVETLKSYYKYKEFQNIHRFYESSLHHKLEKKYKNLARLDVTNCFDSIYTHSISWAIYGKSHVKSNLNCSRNKISFSDGLDKLMQDMNYGETNGIVIGPEFSRIVCEIIMQRIDLDLEKRLGKKDLRFKQDYEILRYVDDFFVFYDDEKSYEIIHSELVSCLHDYKLALNEAKTRIEKTPTISNLSIAKKEISRELVDKSFRISEDKRIGWNFDFDSVVTEFKLIVNKADVYYSDVVPYTLDLVEKKLIHLISKWERRVEGKGDLELDPAFLAKTYEKTLRLVFYMLAFDVPTNAFIIASRITAMMAQSIKKTREMHAEARIPQHSFYRTAIREVSQLIGRLHGESEQIKVLHMVNLAECIEDGFYLDEGLLKNVLNHGEEDYFTLVVLMHYFRNLKRYDDLRKITIDNVKKVVSSLSEGECHRTDQILLTIDIASCPFVDKATRQEIIKGFIKVKKSEPNIAALVSFLRKEPVSFTNWSGTGILEELELKRGLFVY